VQAGPVFVIAPLAETGWMTKRLGRSEGVNMAWGTE